MNDSVIEAHDLRRRYGGAHGYEAVRGVSFAVRGGELFALLGTNGAGKTSTLEVLEGISMPSGGAVRVLGRHPYADRKATGTRVTFRVEDLQTALTELLTWADGRQIVLPGLDARSASLEEAFLAVAAAPHDTTPVGVA